MTAQQHDLQIVFKLFEKGHLLKEMLSPVSQAHECDLFIMQEFFIFRQKCKV